MCSFRVPGAAAAALVGLVLLAPALITRAEDAEIITQDGDVTFRVGAGKSICFESATGGGSSGGGIASSSCHGPHVEWVKGVCVPKPGIYGNSKTQNGVVPLEDLATRASVNALEATVKEDLKTLSKDVIDKFKTSTEAQLKELSSRCIVGANFASDGKCLPVKTCNYPLEYEKSPPTSQSDRVCTKPTACKDTQFESTPLAMKSDRKCSTRKTCTKTQWLKGRGGPTTDDTCADVTTCKSGGAEFETVKPTATSDRACKKTTACTSTEKEVKKPTTTSDRVCAPNHPAGTSQSDPLPVGACKELKAKLPKEKSGWKYVKTKSSGVIKVWCDQETAGGGWMLTLMMSTNGKNSASGHYFPIMSKSPPMYDGVNHEPSWLQTKGFSPAKRADLWTSSGAKDILMESVASGHRVLGDVMSDKAGTLRYVQGNPIYMAASGAAKVGFGKGSINQGNPSPMMQGVIIKGFGRKTGDKVNFVMMGDYRCNCWESVHLQNRPGTVSNYKCTPGAGTWKVFGDNCYGPGCWNKASCAYKYTRFWIR